MLGELSRFAGVQASAVDASSVFKDLFSGAVISLFEIILIHGRCIHLRLFHNLFL